MDTVPVQMAEEVGAVGVALADERHVVDPRLGKRPIDAWIGVIRPAREIEAHQLVTHILERPSQIEIDPRRPWYGEEDPHCCGFSATRSASGSHWGYVGASRSTANSDVNAWSLGTHMFSAGGLSTSRRTPPYTAARYCGSGARARTVSVYPSA